MAGINQLVLMLLCLTMYTAFKVPNIALSPSYKDRSLFCNKLPGRASKASPSALHMSFVQDEMRPYAIKYHSRDQTSQGQLPAQVPFTKWNPTRQDYLHFLVDSLAVYDLIETAVSVHPVLRQIRVPELERTAALRQDIEWMCQFDPTLTVPTTGAAGLAYTAFLQKLLEASDLPGLVCHYYNQYFALSAGGLRIGQFLSGKLLGGKKLSLYNFEGSAGATGGASNAVSGECDDRGGSGAISDVISTATDPHQQSAHPDPHNSHTHSTHSTHATPYASAHSTHSTVTNTGGSDSTHLDGLKDQLRHKIDALAAGWSPEERQRCCTETENCFKYGNEMLRYLHGSAGGTSS